jgi:glyoxylase-like metal-dependent hydrolase (beta-lactamase superfamily II)
MNTQSSWFEVKEVLKNTFLISEPGHAEWINSYLLKTEPPVLIDTGMGIGNIKRIVSQLLAEEDLDNVLVINTHSHYDHIAGNHFFKKIAIHHSEQESLYKPQKKEIMDWIVDEKNFTRPPPPEFDPTTFEISPSHATQLLHDGDIIELSGRSLEIIHAPGHSPGSICLFDSANKVLFSGDVIYEGPLYAHLEDSNVKTYYKTMKKLRQYWQPKITKILPAHNAVPLVPMVIEMMEKAFEHILSGTAEFTVDNGIRRYNFRRFAILTKLRPL